jgi:hypothetical protein
MVREKMEFERRQAEFLKQQEEYERQRQEAEREREKIRNELQQNRLSLLYPYNRAGADVDMATLWALSEDDFNSILNKKKAEHEVAQAAWIKQKEEAAAQKERERIRKEQQDAEIQRALEWEKRQEELAKAKDIEKWEDVIAHLSKTPIHNMRSSQYRTAMKSVKDFLTHILKPV